MPSATPRHPLLYVLHSSNLYGTERIALDTAQGLADEFEPIFFGPPGPAMDEAEKLGLEAHRFRGAKKFAKELRPFLKKYPSMTFIATGVVQSAVCLALNVLYRREIKHFQIVHGGADDRGAYGRKKWLNHTGVTFITVSEWARQKLISMGARADRIEVVPNFLPASRVAAAPRRAIYTGAGFKNVLIVSRLDPLKKVGVLIDALEQGPPELKQIPFKILGVGPEMKPLAERAARTLPNVNFAGFSGDVAGELSRADLLVHTCPIESFGLAVLEAMAANLAVLVPDSGGAGSLVEEGVSGFKFCPDDSNHLAQRLAELHTAPAERFNQAVIGGRKVVDETYSSKTILKRYRTLLAPE